MVTTVAACAPAKVNLCLRVIRRRADGYHELDSIFLPIDWHDLVRVELRPSSVSRIDFRCNRPELADPAANLAARAARAFVNEFGPLGAIAIILEKNLPAGSGLGGGSSDAGAVLRILARIAAISDHARLSRVATAIGADVPYFLDPRPAHVRGIGDRIEKLAPIPRLHLVVAVPPIEVSTAKIFHALAPSGYSGEIPPSHLSAILSGRIPDDALVNDLAAPAIASYPQIARLRTIVAAHGAIATSMSGSGGAVFGIFSNGVAAREAARTIATEASDARVIACQSIDLLEE